MSNIVPYGSPPGILRTAANVARYTPLGRRAQAARTIYRAATNPIARAGFRRFAQAVADSRARRSAANRQATMNRNRGRSATRAGSSRVPNQGNAKKDALETGEPYVMANYTLYTSDISEIVKDTGAFLPNTRRRDIANLRGVKVCMWFHAKPEGTLGVSPNMSPAWVHVAVIEKKYNNDSTLTAGGFLRSYGTERERTMSQATASLRMESLPINTDIYNVLYHTRTTLYPAAQFNDDEWRPTNTKPMWMVKKYVPIKCQLTFNTANEPNRRFFIVSWAYPVGAANNGTVTNQLVAANHSSVVFRESGTF